MSVSATVVIVTFNRPACVKRCLDCLRLQTIIPDQIILVDASTDDQTRDLLARYPDVTYIHSDLGYGHMTASRNMGLLDAIGDVVAFIDDDAYARPDWLEALLAGYNDPQVGAVGGRAIQGESPPQPWVEANKIGKLLPHGYLYAGFDTDTGQVQEVDHMIGCNMSFRRATLAKLGGFRDDFPGTEVCEETDMSLRVRRLGFRICYNPAATVNHMGAPQHKGRRFDARYNYYAAQNNAILFIRNYGLSSAIFLRFLVSTLRDRTRDAMRSLTGTRAAAGGALRYFAYGCGLSIGITRGTYRRFRHGMSPIRNDQFATKLRSRLAVQGPESCSSRREELQLVQRN